MINIIQRLLWYYIRVWCPPVLQMRITHRKTGLLCNSCVKFHRMPQEGGKQLRFPNAFTFSLSQKYHEHVQHVWMTFPHSWDEYSSQLRPRVKLHHVPNIQYILQKVLLWQLNVPFPGLWQSILNSRSTCSLVLELSAMPHCQLTEFAQLPWNCRSLHFSYKLIYKVNVTI